MDVVHSTTESVPNGLQIIVSDRNVLDDTQFDFASKVCDSKILCRIPLINWGMQPQVFKKGINWRKPALLNMVIHYDGRGPESVEGQSVWCVESTTD